MSLAVVGWQALSDNRAFGEPVELVLKYRGDLKSGQSGSKNSLKHSIREKFHYQLAEHWRHDRFLSAQLEHPLLNYELMVKDDGAIGGHWYQKEVAGFSFVPLVVQTQFLQLVCELEITLLLPDYPGGVFTGKEAGDLDNRIKLLFDALTVPQDNQLIGIRPSEALGKHFFCLLENDRFVSGFSVKSHRLLERNPSPNWADVNIRVIIKAAEGSHVVFP